MKCDETRPVCTNCSTTERRCSYTDLLGPVLPVLPVLPLTSHVESPVAAPSTTTLSPSCPLSTPSPSASVLPTEQQWFGLDHLELLYHLGTEFPRAVDPQTMRGEDMMKLVINCALGAPYLMDQALAVAALHLSTIRPARQDFYRHQATQLQTRALSLFNTVQIDAAGANPLARFLFSSFLGQEVMYEAFSARGDFHTFIMGIADCLSLHRGIRAVAGLSWPTIEAQIKPFLGNAYGIGTSQSVGHECDVLIALISSRDLDAPSLNAIRHAVELLQCAFDVQRTNDSQSWHLVNLAMAWPVVAPAEFAGLVKQLQPEALVTLCYYAVILHRARNFWVFGDVGEFMMRSITAHLGSQWEGWLAWPTEMLRRDSEPIV